MKLRNEAFHLLRQLFQQHTARQQRTLPDLTKPRYVVIRSVTEQPGIEQVVLTEAAISTKAMPAEMLSRMEARGLVRREHDPADKHRHFVYLTEQGKALLNRSIPRGNEIDDKFLDRPSGGKREQFTRLVHEVVAS